MENRSQLLSAIQKWQAVKANPALNPACKQWKDAHAAYESALYAAGVYKEALRGQRALSEEVRTNITEPERTFYHWAYCYAVLSPETLIDIQKAKSYSGRTLILDGIQAAFNQVALEKEKMRNAAHQRRTAVLAEEARKQVEQVQAEKAREERHKAELIAAASKNKVPGPGGRSGQSQADADNGRNKGKGKRKG